MNTCDSKSRPNEFTECDDSQSGQRFLDSSVPRLLRQVASCETAGGGFTSMPAGKDQKLSQGFGDRVPNLSALGAAGLPLLDSLTNNRHTSPDFYTRPQGRGKHCGRYSIKGLDPKTGRTIHRRVNCGSWTCTYCGKRKARLAKRRIQEEAARLNLCYFWTLTLAPRKFESPEEQVKHIKRVFNSFREYLKRKHGVALNYVCILEFTQRGVPHLHVLFDRYIPHEWVSNSWDRLGGGKIVYVKRVVVKNVARYLSKYLTKELMFSAPKGARRITTSRTIKLFPKFASGIVWEFIRDSIWNLLASRRSATWARQEDFFRFIWLAPDEEGYLKCFEIVADR